MNNNGIVGASGLILNEPLLWEKGGKGRRGMSMVAAEVPEAPIAPELCGEGPDFPDLMVAYHLASLFEGFSQLLAPVRQQEAAAGRDVEDALVESPFHLHAGGVEIDPGRTVEIRQIGIILHRPGVGPRRMAKQCPPMLVTGHDRLKRQERLQALRPTGEKFTLISLTSMSVAIGTPQPCDHGPCGMTRM